ncbi:MAG: PDZ domain-containing protein [Bdellovibrionales bacterium]
MATPINTKNKSGEESHGLRQTQVGERPRGEKYYIYGLLFFIAFLTADLLIVRHRDLMMPKSAPPARPAPPPRPLAQTSYDKILARNIFNADGLVPPPIGGDGSSSSDENVPVLSQLPIILVGTIVHVNPARSIATVEIKNSNKILPFIPNDDMEGLAKLLKVDRKRAIFRNSNNNRIEYIEIKDDSTIVFETKKKPGAVSTEIDQRGNNFVIKKSLIDKLITNLPEHLQQARAVPYTPPGSSKATGFIILDIQPGSIFEQIGLNKNDILTEVNGQKVDSPARALELYNELKTAGSISIGVERNGRFENLNYSIQ